MFFSLCIPTMDRYDDFLINNLPLYVDNNLINEIIITDENGNDIDKIEKSNIDKTKLKLYKNNNRLGPFMNKLNACRYAKNEWIALIDSDNFADYNYFLYALNYIKTLKENTKVSIISPSFAKPNFNFEYFANNCNIITKHNIKEIMKNFPAEIPDSQRIGILINLGNFIINNYLIKNINIKNELNNIPYSFACDVIYFNTLLLEQFDLHLHVVKNMEYIHVVHPSSIYKLTCNIYPSFNQKIYDRFDKFYKE